MDLGKIAAKGRDIDILHPSTGESTGLKLTLKSPDNADIKAVRRRWQQEMLKAKNNTLTMERNLKFHKEMLLASVSDWEWGGTSSFNGKKLEFSTENLDLVLESEWIATQISEAISDEGAFFSQ